MRLAVVVALLALASGSVWYLVAPPRSADGYRERAAETSETLGSQVQTARLWLRAVDRGEATRPAAKVGLEEAAADAASAVAELAALDPPPGTAEVRTGVLRVGQAASDTLAALRIAVHQGEWERAVEAEDPLLRLAEELEHVTGEVRP